MKINTKFAQTAREVLNRTIEDLRKQVVTYALIEAYEVMEGEGLDKVEFSVETGTSDPTVWSDRERITKIVKTIDVEDCFRFATRYMGYDESREAEVYHLDKDDVLARIRTAFPGERFPQ